MRYPTRAALMITLVSLGLGGCSRAVRPDAEVSAIVEREDRRLAEVQRLELAARAAAALASAGEALGELASVDVAADGLLWGPLYVPNTKAAAGQSPTADLRVLPPEPPRGWPHLEGYYSAWALEEAEASQAESDDEVIMSDDGPGGRRRKGNNKPKLRLDLMRMRLNGNPVSFSGSLKGGKGVQLKATIKM